MPTALLSVYHKKGIVDFARDLVALGWTIIASGGTARVLHEAGVPVRNVADIVGGGAILDHRVVTLSRELHAGLLARIPDDEIEMAKLGLSYVDLVCVDLYPLQIEIDKPESTLTSVIGMTDIGGPAALRSGAKGDRIVICDPNDRTRVLDWLRGGQQDRDSFINNLAAKAEGIVADYCLASARYRSDGGIDGFVGTRTISLCYGENPQQSPAAFFSTGGSYALSLDRFQLVRGSAPSYANFCDCARLIQTITHIAATFDVNRDKVPLIAIGCKHGNPCGCAIGDQELCTTERMATGDPLSLSGGLVITNFPITRPVADRLLNAGGKRILDGVMAPHFDEPAMEILQRRNDRCRMYQNPALADLSRNSLDTTPIFRQVPGGFLRQPNYTFVLDLADPVLEKPSNLDPKVEDDLLLGWAIGSTSNSNTVSLVKGGMLLGNGVGQQDRVGGAELAIVRARRAFHDLQDAVAYSDSFFPFTDGPALLHGAGIRTILASSGSIKDSEVRSYCSDNGIALCMIPDKHGRGFFGH